MPEICQGSGLAPSGEPFLRVTRSFLWPLLSPGLPGLLNTHLRSPHPFCLHTAVPSAGPWPQICPVSIPRHSLGFRPVVDPGWSPHRALNSALRNLPPQDVSLAEHWAWGKRLSFRGRTHRPTAEAGALQAGYHLTRERFMMEVRGRVSVRGGSVYRAGAPRMEKGPEAREAGAGFS